MWDKSENSSDNKESQKTKQSETEEHNNLCDHILKLNVFTLPTTFYVSDVTFYFLSSVSLKLIIVIRVIFTTSVL